MRFSIKRVQLFKKVWKKNDRNFIAQIENLIEAFRIALLSYDLIVQLALAV